MENDTYSVRSGEHPTGGKVSLAFLRRFVSQLFEDYRMRGYFHNEFGFPAEALMQTPQQLAAQMSNLRFEFGTVLMAETRKDYLWPINDQREYTQHDILDLIEFFVRHTSKPIVDSSLLHPSIKGYNKLEAFIEIRSRVNSVLPYFETGWELANHGEIRRLPPSGLEGLVDETLPDTTNQDVVSYVNAAIGRFLFRDATEDDRRAALKELADALEKLKPEAEKLLTRKDEKDLFETLNRFGVRHANLGQQTDYDKEIFYEWLFYYYLAAIRALTRLIDRQEKEV